ncbi:MAG: 3-isopropylmalate dehydratase small subunit [Deltaproteobacteria bacterium]|nr:3-isopropylmalate dehydratase small subunit [Deltaproteobacteria bacterium]
MKGTAHKIGDDINTDYIIAGKHKRDTFDAALMAPHLFEDLDPGLASRIKPGDIIVAGKNFGCGSSREAAPMVIQAAGVSAVLAPSFARIFFRNAINIGLPLLQCDTSAIDDGDLLEIDIAGGVIRDKTHKKDISFKKLPEAMSAIFREGGLVPYLKKHKQFPV